MPLATHDTVNPPSTFGLDSKSAAKERLNDNFDLCEANDQTRENRQEDTTYDVHGSGVLQGLEPTVAGSGLSINFTAGIALIGYSISLDAGSIAVTASMNPGYVYLRQDGTFHDAGGSATPPTGIASVLYATYTSDGYDALTVTLNARGVHLDQIDADVAGALSVMTIKHGVMPVDRDFWIAGVTIVVADSGDLSPSGDNDYVIVDVHVGDAGAAPTTIFTDQDDRPMVIAEAYPYTTDSAIPAVRVIEAGQVFTVEIDGAPANSDGLGVVIYGRWCDIA